MLKDHGTQPEGISLKDFLTLISRTKKGELGAEQSGLGEMVQSIAPEAMKHGDKKSMFEQKIAEQSKGSDGMAEIKAAAEGRKAEAQAKKDRKAAFAARTRQGSVPLIPHLVLLLTNPCTQSGAAKFG